MDVQLLLLRKEKNNEEKNKDCNSGTGGRYYRHCYLRCFKEKSMKSYGLMLRWIE